MLEIIQRSKREHQSGGWKRRWSLESGLPETVSWYRENRAWWEQIKQSGGYRDYYARQYANRLSS